MCYKFTKMFSLDQESLIVPAEPEHFPLIVNKTEHFKGCPDFQDIRRNTDLIEASSGRSAALDEYFCPRKLICKIYRSISDSCRHLIPVAVIASGGIVQFLKLFVPVPEAQIEEIIAHQLIKNGFSNPATRVLTSYEGRSLWSVNKTLRICTASALPRSRRGGRVWIQSGPYRRRDNALCPFS
jgi:hypothetical protein